MKYEFATAILWGIAIAVTVLTVQPAAWSILGPVYAVCMIGSIVTVRTARVEPLRKR